jgi:hypothetical protein
LIEEIADPVGEDRDAVERLGTSDVPLAAMERAAGAPKPYAPFL